MRRPEKDEEKFSACGYGLLGLCCSNCLLGPCRISPFEKDSEKGLCGDSSDVMVAKNLFKSVAGETLEELGSLKRAVERSSSLRTEGNAKRDAFSDNQREIFEKYGLPPKRTRKALSRFLFAEAEKLLSPMSRGQSLLLKNLYPEETFPSLYQVPFPPGSLMGYLLDSTGTGSAESSGIETILWNCLQISTAGIICEELKKDINGIFEERADQEEGQILDTLKTVSSHPSPVIIVVEDEKYGSRESIQPIAQRLKESIKGEVPLLSVKAVALLPEIGRRLYKKWTTPVVGTKVMVWISSASTTWTLGALELGFNVISFPSLPIHGSDQVERFFSETLKKRFGNVYFHSWRENLLDEVLEFLTWKS
ncbi:MAG: hypothetical protein FJ130_06655 [Deltaproteobacteria bacterium]|nr:hypothetical protein [Deltaproteobacteria bacterium]